MSAAPKGASGNASVLIVPSDDRLIVWFDIDNTLYPASVKMAEKMGEKIHGMQLFSNSRLELFLSHPSVSLFLGTRTQRQK
jgi:hypothetical protein